MTDAMAHRGPDGRGVVMFPGDPPAGLGHRRLAIIDPDPSGRAADVVRRSLVDHLQRRALQLPRASRGARGDRGAVRHRLRHGGAAAAVRARRPGDAPASQRDLRLRGLGRRGQAALPGARQARRQAAVLTRATAECSRSPRSSGRSCRSSAEPRSTRTALADYLTFLWVPGPEDGVPPGAEAPAGPLRLGRPGRDAYRAYWDLSFEPGEAPKDSEWVDLVADTVNRERAQADGQRRPARRVPERRGRLVGDRRRDVVVGRAGAARTRSGSTGRISATRSCPTISCTPAGSRRCSAPTRPSGSSSRTCSTCCRRRSGTSRSRWPIRRRSRPT